MTNIACEYQIGESLPPRSPSYVWRQADRQIYESLRSGIFCLVLAPPQSGKSSLCLQAMRRLRQVGIACANIDLSKIVKPELTESQFYARIAYSLANRFNLLEDMGGLKNWWQQKQSLHPLSRLAKFLGEVLLSCEFLSEKNIVIFVDEIDSAFRLPFSVNNFFRLIRACYDRRTSRPEYKRLTFALSGVASPADLLGEENNPTPFSFARTIELNNFQLQEAEPLAEGLKLKSSDRKQLLAAVLSWTGGQPFLTQKLCKLIADAEDSPSIGEEASWTANLVQKRAIENWQSQDEPKHLRRICDRLLPEAERSIELLKLYRQILAYLQPPLSKEAISADVASIADIADVASIADIPDDTRTKIELQLSGLAVKQAGKLTVTNRIYEAVFNINWVEENLQLLQPEEYDREREFTEALAELERQLLVSQLANVAEGKGSERVLYEVVREIALLLGDLLGADRSTIFLLNPEKNELWSLVAEHEGDEFLDIQVRLGEGIAGQSAQTKQVIHIADNLYGDPRSILVKKSDRKYRYQTYNVLAFPILNDETEVVAIVQLLNKLALQDNLQQPLSKRIDRRGFSAEDRIRLAKFAPPICKIMESCQSSYKATKKLRATAALAEATRSLDKSSLDTKEILQRVMDAAKKLMNADRSTLWLVDRDRGDLWTELADVGELRCDIGTGFAGQVAQSLEPMVIPFDLYDEPNANHAKKTDLKTGYRTCSLLCMPVLNPDGELLGVTQLLNKRKVGDYPEYDFANWPEPPEQFQASFDESDRQSMQVFNERAGVVLQYARTHEALELIAKIKPKESVHNTLSMLSHAVGNESDEALYQTLYNMLEFTTESIRSLLGAEQAMMFLFSAEENEFWTLHREKFNRAIVELRVPTERGVAREISTSKPGNWLYNVPSLIPTEAIAPLRKMSVCPLFNRLGNLVAAVQFFEGLTFSESSATARTEQLERRAESVLPILEGFQSFHREIRTIQGKRAIEALWSAIRSTSQSSENSPAIVRLVMEAAKKLTNADRSSLWLLDRDRGDLWTKIPKIGELRCPLGTGFAGTVAASRQQMAIPFDLYDSPNADYAKKIDWKTGYRTCSLLCMPIFSFDGDLLGVTQLLNKCKPGEFPEYNMDDWPRVPDHFKVSFNQRDRRYMEIFNNQVGIILEKARQAGMENWEWNGQ